LIRYVEGVHRGTGRWTLEKVAEGTRAWYTEAQRVFSSITGMEEYVFERKANGCDGITSKEK